LDKLIRKLSPTTVTTLLTHEFDVQVPAEFYKGKETNRTTLLTVEPATGRPLLRYRRDILPDPPSEDPEACRAVAELHALLEGNAEKEMAEVFAEDVFRENVVLLMDNARFLHSRTEIKDPQRLLRRVRFHGTPAS
jgi:alpha-ketoglutarate-dependent taurine dioxygenase